MLNGHDHDYERFAPQRPDGVADPARGLREIIVGSGGKSIVELETPRPNSEVRRGRVYGVLQLTLHPSTYDFRFVSLRGEVLDEGQGTCHGR